MTKTKFHPLGKNILIRPEVVTEEKTPGGIIKPTAYQQPSSTGFAIAVGPEVKGVKAGERVAFKWINRQDVFHEGETMALLPEELILGVIE
jgi:co-chaperonin GroES (HSP10)